MNAQVSYQNSSSPGVSANYTNLETRHREGIAHDERYYQ